MLRGHRLTRSVKEFLPKLRSSRFGENSYKIWNGNPEKIEGFVTSKGGVEKRAESPPHRWTVLVSSGCGPETLAVSRHVPTSDERE